MQVKIQEELKLKINDDQINVNNNNNNNFYWWFILYWCHDTIVFTQVNIKIEHTKHIYIYI